MMNSGQDSGRTATRTFTLRSKAKNCGQGWAGTRKEEEEEDGS